MSKTLRKSRKGSRRSEEESGPPPKGVPKALTRLDRKMSKYEMRQMLAKEVDLEPMPGHEELEKIFKEAVIEMAIPEAQYPMMFELSDEKKWEIIKQQKILKKKQDSAGDDKHSALKWVELLKGRTGDNKPTLSVEDAREMHTALRTGHRKFLVEFIEAEGIENLNAVTDYYTNHSERSKRRIDLVGQLVQMYRVLLNNNIGMEAALNVPGTVTSVKMCVDYNVVSGSDMVIATTVVELLSVVCWFSKRGLRRVAEAIQAFRIRRKEALRYQHLVMYLEHAKSLPLKNAISVFITTICNSYNELEDRVIARKDFMVLDVVKVFERILPKAKAAKKEKDKQLWQNIKNQYQVFVSMLKRDQAALMHKLIATKDDDDEEQEVDMGDVEDVFSVVQRHSGLAGCEEQLLKLTHALLFIPTESTLAVPIYTSITSYVYEATHVDQLESDGAKSLKRKDFTTPPPLNFKSLTKLYDDKLEMDAKLSQMKLTDEVVKKMSQKIDELKIENERLRQGGKGGAAGGGKTAAPAMPKPKNNAAPAPTTDTAPELKIMKEREKKLLYEISELKKELAKASRGKPQESTSATSAKNEELLKNYKGPLDSTGLIPAGPAPGVKVMPIPACPHEGMPGSLENAPVKVAGKSGGGGKKGAQKEEKSSAALAIEKLGLPAKKSPKPDVKMTHIFWTPVAAEKLEGTIWPELSDQKVDFMKPELERLFGAHQTLKSVKSTATLKPQKTELLDPTRKQNLGISLKAAVSVDPVKVKNALLAVDDPLMTNKMVMVLLSCVPTEDEVQILKKFTAEGGDVSKLEKEEKFLLEMIQVPRMSERLHCMKTRYTLDENLEAIAEFIWKLRQAVTEIEENPKLRRILEIILAIGNYANGGTARGGAWGFKIELLGKIEQIKDTENHAMTRFLLRLFRKKYPDLVDFKVPKSREVENSAISDYAGDLNSVAAAVQKLKTELEQPLISSKDQFKKIMSKFEVTASQKLANVQAEFEKARGAFYNLAAFFGESGPKVEPKTFFSRFVALESGLTRARLQLAKEEEDRIRKAKMKEDKQRRQTLMKLRKLQEKTSDPNLFEAFKRAQKGTSVEVAERFIEKWKREQAKKSQSSSESGTLQRRNTPKPNFRRGMN